MFAQYLEASANFLSKNQSDAKANFLSFPWVVYLRASHHRTSDTHDIQHPKDYTGTIDIAVGDSNRILITHTCQVILNASTKNFTLSHTLCAPNIKHCLLSVFQVWKVNLTSIEFSPCKFLIKDLSLGHFWHKVGIGMDSMSGHVILVKVI